MSTVALTLLTVIYYGALVLLAAVVVLVLLLTFGRSLELLHEWHQERRLKRLIQRTAVEVEELEALWAFPPKWHPQPAETHLGKKQVGRRRGA